MRIDKFIIRHLEYLEGRLLLTTGTFDQKTPNVSKDIMSPVKNSDAPIMDKSFSIKMRMKEKMKIWRIKIQKIKTRLRDRY